MNQDIIVKDLVVSGNPVLDAGAIFTSDMQELSRSYELSFQFVKAGTDGNPILTVEVSLDGVNFSNPYIDIDGITPITFELVNTSTIAFDSIIPFKYVRIVNDPNGTTTGTISAKIGLPVDA